jgi:hypothetical protein
MPDAEILRQLIKSSCSFDAYRIADYKLPSKPLKRP